jgi:hypothetical protein
MVSWPTFEVKNSMEASAALPSPEQGPSAAPKGTCVQPAYAPKRAKKSREWHRDIGMSSDDLFRNWLNGPSSPKGLRTNRHIQYQEKRPPASDAVAIWLCCTRPVERSHLTLPDFGTGGTSASVQELSFVLGQWTVITTDRKWTCALVTFLFSPNKLVQLALHKKQALFYG